MTERNEDLKNHIEKLAEKGTGYMDMTTLIVQSLGGTDEFNKKCWVVARQGADSFETYLTDDAAIALFNKHKSLILGHAEHLSLLLKYNSVGDLMVHSDWSGWVADFGVARLDSALMDEENKGYVSAVSYLVRYLAQQVCVDYVAYLESIDGAVAADVKSYLKNADGAESALATLIVDHYGNELNFHQKYPTIAEEGVGAGVRWTEFNSANATDFYDKNKEVVLGFATELAQEYGHDSVAELVTYTEYNRRGWIGMSADTINNRLYDPAAANREGVIWQFINFLVDEISANYKSYLNEKELASASLL